MEVIIEYTNAKGETSQRDIRVVTEQNGLLKAHCHMRDAARTFRFDRIKAVYDCDTGEEISIESVRQAIMSLSRNGLNGLPDIVSGGVKVLLALASCDGEIDEREMQAIYNFACNHTDCHGIDVDSVIQMVNDIKIQEIEDSSVNANIQKRYGGEPYRHFYRAVRNTVDADGSISEEETKFLVEL